MGNRERTQFTPIHKNREHRSVRNSKWYQVTLPVVNGVIQDSQNILGQLRNDCVCSNQRRAEAVAIIRASSRIAPAIETVRWVVDLKYRGPRLGRRYTTLRDCAYAVDVYKRLRQEWR